LIIPGDWNLFCDGWHKPVILVTNLVPMN